MADKPRCDICGRTKMPLWRFCLKEGGRLHTRCRKHLDEDVALRDLRARKRRQAARR